MPGENCAVFGYGSCRRMKGIGIWKLPSAKDEAHSTWRKEWLGEIKKMKDLDQNFKELIENDRVFTCEKHFAAEDIEICKYSFSNSVDLRFYLNFDFALFSVWLFYKPAVLLKCSYHQNFYFLISFYISHNERLRKKNAIWIKCNLF